MRRIYKSIQPRSNSQQLVTNIDNLQVESEVCPTKKFNYKVCICGVGNNLSAFFKTTITNLFNIANSFEESKIIIIESDSTDNTVKLFSGVQNIIFKSLGNLHKELPDRSKRIAFCRNEYIRIVLSEYSTYDLMIVVDLDDVMSEHLNMESFVSCLSEDHYDKWDAVFANQSYRYYDIWALRNDEVNYDCWDKVNRNEMSKLDAILKHQYHIPKNSDAIPVISAFGGLGIYKIKHLDENSKYDGASEETMDGCVCEHVAFNKYLVSKGCKLFIDPQLILETPTSFAKYYI